VSHPASISNECRNRFVTRESKSGAGALAAGAKDCMNPVLLAALICSSSMAALGQLFLKIGADKVSGPSTWLNMQILLGLACYFVGLVLWIYGLSRAPLHVVYPFTMLTFVLVSALGIGVLDEHVAPGAVVGWTLICAGVGFLYFTSVGR
jgi:drug/metabolite transporter (DMT)-like permease